ncbi:MAG: chorismate mutase [Acidobacteria bacterium]|jgi:chorismate mutase|uniref:chorismate mutase n=1 Tax=Paludibaculum fermentans TaxID=1473598 RepID=A0A7S7NQC9_PALFE|nr:chorismate mutase [Paludibaculum fermentans]MBN9660658.1 chorismate mutase [Acidobacteriota bacterium]QOY87852.1 chorismate mutase [Paludibaculum fermentans]
MTNEEAQAALADLRTLIDDVDLRILALFNERADVVSRIGDIKKTMTMPIYEPKREDEVFRNVLQGNRGPLSEGAVRRLFERIIDEMRTLQRERMERDKTK